MENRIKVMVDTNVLLDYLIPSRKGHEAALALFELILAVKVEAAFSTQSVMDAVYVCRKEKEVPEKEIRSVLYHLLCRINAGAIDTLSARQALQEEHPDVEDSAHIAFAYDECCDVIVTGDNGMLAREVPRPMKVMTPEEFVDNCRA